MDKKPFFSVSSKEENKVLSFSKNSKKQPFSKVIWNWLFIYGVMCLVLLVWKFFGKPPENTPKPLYPAFNVLGQTDPENPYLIDVDSDGFFLDKWVNGATQIADSPEISMKIREWESKKPLMIEIRKRIRDNSVRIYRFAECSTAMSRAGLTPIQMIQRDPRVPKFLVEVYSFQSAQFQLIAQLSEEIAALEEAAPQLKDQTRRARAVAVNDRRTK